MAPRVRTETAYQQASLNSPAAPGAPADRGRPAGRPGETALPRAGRGPERGTTARSGTKGKKGKAGRRGPARGPARRRRRSPSAGGPVVILAGWVGRAISAAWMAVAGALGFAVRSVGRGARDLDPDHRRDGLGLFTLGVAIVLAAGEWARMGNPVGHGIQQVAGGAFGALAGLTPVLVALLAWRFLRHPDRNSDLGEMISALNASLGTRVTTISGAAPPGEILFVRRVLEPPAEAPPGLRE
jgi:DNA segregation ATPase FtsK/SpoIIIE, S-DNA-T family